ncbi:MAG: hypothetical protein SNJ59_12090 [Aggregatilineales bacterium]
MTNEKGTKSERRRPRASERRAASGSNPLRTVSASSRRAERAVRRGNVPAEASKKTELDHAKLAELLHNPTKFVSEEELRREYAYVLNDLKSMGLLAAGLVVLLITLALVLPV